MFDLTGYQLRLLVFLSVATFFEGYDFMALSRILGPIRETYGLSEFGGGVLFAVVNAGTVAAYLLVRQADRWGRRGVLMLTILGYTLFTALSGLAPNAWVFGACQFVARVFLIGEWATAIVYAAEEFPADKRGTVIGLLQAFSSMGAIVCAGVAPLLLNTPYGWRSVYFVGVVPLLVLALARRNLKETRRFEEQRASGDHQASDLFAIWRSPYAKRLVQIALIWLITYTGTNTAIGFWADYAGNDLGMSEADISKIMVVGSVGSLPLVFAAGWLLDWLGRRIGAVIIFGATAAGIFGGYYFTDFNALLVCMVLSVFGLTAVMPVLNAYTSELFPTSMRADAFAWANNLLGRIGYVLAPLAVGSIAQTTGYGAPIRPLALAPIIAVALIWIFLPETKGQELEETAAL